MSDAAKIGIVAVILWAGGTILAFRAPPPTGFALSFIAFVLCCIAAWRGSKWWLTLPFAMLVELCLGLFVGLRAV
ncbi:MAG TPA: hypothetical protein VN734_01560 [Acidobacteriaceae bacterium]|nr:hypothetical protein [Acidobacteriaceae bacterium]